MVKKKQIQETANIVTLSVYYNAKKILKANQIDEAVRLLKNSELIALPTETVYGLAANSKNKRAIHKIFDVKGRPRNHPLILT